MNTPSINEEPTDSRNGIRSTGNHVKANGGGATNDGNREEHGKKEGRGGKEDESYVEACSFVDKDR